jgi:hypothetical protein
MQPDPEKRIAELEKQVKEIQNILFGLSNDTRTVSLIRGSVIIGEHTTDKPTIISKAGKKYNLQTV